MLTKRIFDFVAAGLGILIFAVPLLVFWLLASFDTGSNGLFCQIRIGQYGQPFVIYKLKSIHPVTGNCSALGRWLRKYKVDEWPQLFNVLKGEMSLVGPRPDIPGYYDLLEGDDRKVLLLKPGITSEVSLKYSNEEQLLAAQADPLSYNDFVIFPDKVRMNLSYLKDRNFRLDLKIILKTIFIFVPWRNGKR